MNYKSNVEDYLKVINGRNFIKNAIFDSSQNTLLMNFYQSYDEHNELETEYKISSKEEFDLYFQNETSIEKIVVIEFARLLKNFKEIDNISATMYSKGNRYDVNVNRESLNSLIGFDISDQSTWDNFIGVYNQKDKRKELFEHLTV